MNLAATTTIPDAVTMRAGDLLQQAPVDVLEVARRLGLEVYSSVLRDGVSGAIIRDGKVPAGFVIHVNRNEPSVRQRFTAAHEIGHYCLHRNIIGDGVEDNYMLRSNRMSNRMEAEANKFAADLLMPFHLVNRLISQGTNDVPTLARALGVSEVAMAIRLGHPT